MGKRHRGQNRGFAWPIIIFGGVLLIAAVFLLANRSGGGNDHGMPAIVVGQQRIDYGYVQFGGERSFSIRVTNTGQGVLRFKEKPFIQVMEGC